MIYGIFINFYVLNIFKLDMLQKNDYFCKYILGKV